MQCEELTTMTMKFNARLTSYTDRNIHCKVVVRRTCKVRCMLLTLALESPCCNSANTQRRELQKTPFLAPIFMEGRPQFLYGKLLAGPIVHRLAKFGRVPFADLRLRSLAIKWNAKIYGGWVKTHFQFEAVSGPKFMLF